MVSPQPRALSRAVRSARRRSVLQPADRAAPSDRVLRRTSARLQLQHAGQARRSAARASTRGWRRCSPGASIPTRQAGDRARNRGRWPDRARSSAVRRRRPIGGDRRACARGPRSPGHPLLDRAEAVFTILEHEAMHQETLLYMWHRLPFEQKRRPPATCRAPTAASPASEWIDVPGGSRDAGRRPRRDPFGWDNEFRRACARRSRAFAIERHDVTNARFSSSSRRAAIARSGGGRRRIGRGCRTERVQSSAVLGARATARGAGARCSSGSAAAVVAGLCQPGRSSGVCAMARRAPADRGGIPARRVRIARRRAAAIRGATTSRTAATACSTSRVGILNRPAAIQQDRAPGASRIWSATAGNGPARRSRRFPASARWRRIRSIRPISSTASTSS